MTVVRRGCEARSRSGGGRSTNRTPVNLDTGLGEPPETIEGSVAARGPDPGQLGWSSRQTYVPAAHRSRAGEHLQQRCPWLTLARDGRLDRPEHWRAVAVRETSRGQRVRVAVDQVGQAEGGPQQGRLCKADPRQPVPMLPSRRQLQAVRVGGQGRRGSRVQLDRIGRGAPAEPVLQQGGSAWFGPSGAKRDGRARASGVIACLEETAPPRGARAEALGGGHLHPVLQTPAVPLPQALEPAQPLREALLERQGKEG